MDAYVDPIIFTSAIMRLTYGLLAVYGAVLMSRWLDIRGKITFGKDILPSIKNAPVAAAIYFGLRFMAICWLIGAVAG